MELIGDGSGNEIRDLQRERERVLSSFVEDEDDDLLLFFLLYSFLPSL